MNTTVAFETIDLLHTVWDVTALHGLMEDTVGTNVRPRCTFILHLSYFDFYNRKD